MSTTTLKSTLPKFLNRKSKWKNEVRQTNTLQKWHGLISKLRNDCGLDESVHEELIQNLLADILDEHAEARELEDYFTTIMNTGCICGKCYIETY